MVKSQRYTLVGKTSLRTGLLLTGIRCLGAGTLLDYRQNFEGNLCLIRHLGLIVQAGTGADPGFDQGGPQIVTDLNC